MRPIKLKMSAFGPYVKTTELDFDSGLKGGNFFLIHGATGSGKTTILDAICYALYGESSGGARKSSMLRSEQALPTVKTEVEFIFSLRGKIYRIVRSPKYERAKLRGGGTTEEKAFAEIYVDGEFISTRDVSEYVRELLQFDSEQFRQVVVLPQGAFQKFLLAKSSEKQAVLDMLFDAEFFKRVEDGLKVKAAAAKENFDGLDARKKNLLEEAGVPEEELPALMEKSSGEFVAAQAQLKILETQAAEAQKNFGDGKNLFKLFQNLETRSNELLGAKKFFGRISADLSAARIELDKRTAEESLREKLKLQAAELDSKKISLRKLKAKRQELKAALAAAEDSSADVERLKKLKTTCDELMAQLKAEVEEFRDAPAKLKVAEQKLKDAEAHEKLLAEIKKLREKNFFGGKKINRGSKIL